MGYPLKSVYRFPYNFTKDYLRPSHYIGWVRHIYQRARYGVSVYDTFNLDSHLARILIHALTSFYNGRSYAINVTIEDRTEEGFWKSLWTDEEQAAAQARWDAMVTEIITSLTLLYDEDAALENGYDEEMNERLNEVLHRFVDHFQAFWL